MTFDLDLSSLPALLAALGSGQQLALLTADGITWTASIQSGGLAPFGVAPSSDPKTAFAALVQRTSGQAAAAVQAATATATAVATVATAVAAATPLGPPQPAPPAI